MKIKIGVGVCCLALAALALCNSLSAGGSGLKVGDPAPKFTSTDDQGKEWKSSNHVGKKIVVVYFYPADMTGGCTKQACGFRDDLAKLTDMGVEVVGVSGDSVKNHKLFKKVHKLPFTLLADEEGKVAKKFGVPVNEGGTIKAKDDEGNVHSLVRGVTTARWTFVINKAGKIAMINNKVKPGEDSKKIIDTVKDLK